LGTDVASIIEAIGRAWSDAGVAVLVDLGGAETNSEMAIDMLESDRREKVVVCEAPIVEGAVMAATEASEARRSTRFGVPPRNYPRHDDRSPHDPVPKTNVVHTGCALLTNDVGLHARPSVKLTTTREALWRAHRIRAQP
jgi:hypothetical protein